MEEVFEREEIFIFWEFSENGLWVEHFFRSMPTKRKKFQKISPTESSPEPTSMYEVLNWHMPDNRSKQGLGNSSGWTIWTFHWL